MNLLTYLLTVNRNYLPVRVLGDTSGDFVVNALTGQLSSRQPLDRELSDVYRLIVAAVDVGQPRLSSLTTVTIHVRDDNDHSPQFEVRLICSVVNDADTDTAVSVLRLCRNR